MLTRRQPMSESKVMSFRDCLILLALALFVMTNVFQLLVLADIRNSLGDQVKIEIVDPDQMRSYRDFG